MRFFLKYLIFSCLCLCLFSTCKRYKDNKGIQLRSVDYRIRGSYLIKSYIVNGQDSTSFLLQSNKEILFIHERHTYTGKIDGYNDGLWKLSDDKRWINIRAANYITGGTGNITPLYTNLLFACADTYIGWRILKLTTKEFWITTNYNNIIYELHFQKTEQL